MAVFKGTLMPVILCLITMLKGGDGEGGEVIIFCSFRCSFVVYNKVEIIFLGLRVVEVSGSLKSSLR